jgi:hypothetical protein
MINISNLRQFICHNCEAEINRRTMGLFYKVDAATTGQIQRRIPGETWFLIKEKIEEEELPGSERY